MKKGLKWTLIIVSAIIVIFAGAVGAMYLPMLQMKPASTGQVLDLDDLLYAVRNSGFSTVYVIKTENGHILFDAGANAAELEASLLELGIDPADVRWVFLTHSDYDHVAGLPLFPNAEIFMSEDELPLVNGTVKRNFMGWNSLPKGIDVDRITLLPDGQEINFYRMRLKCIKAPGHTIGSMLYLVDGLLLFSGDAFKVVNGKIKVHPFSMDKAQAKKTIKQVRSIVRNSDIVLTSHYGYHEKNSIRH